ncbi:MAG TPA: hypothetical protein VGY66_04685 [Gemmataceae bacterium]|nr:hypothetical protein [Gemmataceae bacterium]
MAVSAINALEAMGLNAADDFARSPAQVTMDDLEQADWIVALKHDEHLPLLQERFPAWTEKVEYWQVDDTPEVLSLIEREVMDLAARLIAGGKTREAQPLADLKDNKQFGHWLPKCWTAFKALFPSEDLTEFDPMVAELDKFEKIRYPDHLLAKGASIGFGFGRGRVIQNMKIARPVPEYQMGIGDVDAFFARAIRLCHMNPQPYFSFLTETGREMLLKYNDEAKDWLDR